MEYKTIIENDRYSYRVYIDGTIIRNGRIGANGNIIKERKLAPHINSSGYQSLIEGNEAAIARYKKLIRDLESQNAGARQMISAITTDKQMADDNVRDKVEILIGRQRF